MGIFDKIKRAFKPHLQAPNKSRSSHFDTILKQHPEGFSDHFERDTNDKIKSIEARFWYSHKRAYDDTLQIDKRLQSCENAIDAYFELDNYCSQIPEAKKYFKDNWEYFYFNKQYGLITELTDQLKYLKEHREEFRREERSKSSGN